MYVGRATDPAFEQTDVLCHCICCQTASPWLGSSLLQTWVEKGFKMKLRHQGQNPALTYIHIIPVNFFWWDFWLSHSGFTVKTCSLGVRLQHKLELLCVSWKQKIWISGLTFTVDVFLCFLAAQLSVFDLSVFPNCLFLPVWQEWRNISFFLPAFHVSFWLSLKVPGTRSEAGLSLLRGL